MEPEIRVDGHSRLAVHVLSHFALSSNSLLVVAAEFVIPVLRCCRCATPSELLNRRETSLPASAVRALLCGSQKHTDNWADYPAHSRPNWPHIGYPNDEWSYKLAVAIKSHDPSYMYIWWLTKRSMQGNLYKRTTIMDREGFAKVSRWCLEIFFSRKFNITQLLYYGCHHMWRMPAGNPGL